MNIFKKIKEYLLKKSKEDPNKHRYFYESDIIDNDGKEYKPLMNSHGVMHTDQIMRMNLLIMTMIRS